MMRTAPLGRASRQSDIESVTFLLLPFEDGLMFGETGLDLLLCPARGLADAAAFVGRQLPDAAQHLAQLTAPARVADAQLFEGLQVTSGTDGLDGF